MTLRRACSFGFLAAFVVACGGSVFSHNDGEGGTSSAGGSSSTSGKPSRAGSSSSAGSNAVGGVSGSAGAIGIAGGSNLGCEGVECQPLTDCPSGYALGQPAGACCVGCVPQPGGVACPKVACPHSICPLGYVGGALVGGCCTECVPDALFCNDNSDCLVADQPRSCCGCPEIINRRQYDAEPCWSDILTPRTIPQSCYPQAICDAVCGPCPAPPSVSCQNHRCWDIGLK
jgi:hypothetical protein